ncbi:CsbD family protein [Longispora sp. NPDC051575]|uniref:CsbD family protein n=1 Tax=Longispora sp. NPDC051575 TaxID=3154943 RepID=UPI003441658D
MGFEGKKDELVGKAKEKLGEATGNKELEAEGLADQGKGKLEQAGDAIKDKVEDLKNKFK